MKKLILPLVAIMSMLFAACSPAASDPVIAAQKDVTQQDTTTPIQVVDSWQFIGYDLSEFKNQTVKIDFSCEMKVANNTGSDINLMWQVNESPTSYPVVAEQSFPAGTSEWTTVASTEEQKNTSISLGASNLLYLSTYELDTTKISIELRNVQYTVHYYKKANQVEWIDESVPSLKEAFSDYYDSFGLAVGYRNELESSYVQQGLAKHVDSITMGNEFKPQFLFGWWQDGITNPTLTDFTASNGLTIKVPASLDFNTADNCLKICKDNGLKMRGHVLTWHAQTPDGFFAENYVPEYNDSKKNTLKNPVSPEVMTARHEWYIKTVLTHVAEWEAANNNGEHIIWAWDVINETVADDASGSTWCRGSTASTKDVTPAPAGQGTCGSRWYQVYKSTEFITNAFRFANAYAPADVKLCYNDYNEYQSNKIDGCIKLINLVQNGVEQKVAGKKVKPRIDVMGMQAHIGTQWPGTSSFESAIKQYLKYVDIHVTEFDVNNASTSAESKSAYTSYFNVMNRYGKKYSGTHQIKNVTIWGINNESSWIESSSKYPLLFSNYAITDSFTAVINTAK